MRMEIERFMTGRRVLGLLAVLWGLTGATGRAEMFGIHFLGNTTAVVTNRAGVRPMTGWNNITNGSFASGVIYASDGKESATFSMSGAGQGNGWSNVTVADGADGSLMKGYADAAVNAPITNTIAGLTGAAYTVYLYLEGDTARPANSGDRLPNYTVNGVTYYAAAAGGTFTGFIPAGLTLTNSNVYPAPVTYGNYVEIDDVVPLGGTITVVANAVNATWRSPLNGIELAAETATADIAIGAYDAAFLINGTGGTYYASGLTNAAPDGFWVQALDIEGLEDAYERTHSPQQLQLITDLLRTFLVQNPPGWTWDGWNDDIGWVSLVLARGAQMTGNATFLSEAEYGFNMAFARGWDTTFNGGGIWEQQGHDGKAPLSNDSLAEAACYIYLCTSNTIYRSRAEQIYGWVRTNIFNPTNGLVYEEVDTNGAVNLSPAVYNQGTFIDLANLLYEITGQAVYFNDAGNAIQYVRNNLTDNGILSNGATYLNTWAAEFARGLGHYVAYNQLWSTYYPWMQANAAAAWTNRRTDLNLCGNAWAQPTPVTPAMLTSWCVSAVALWQFTPTNEPGLIPCTNVLHGTVIGTAGSFGNSGNTAAKVFDGDLTTFFDAPVASGAWAGLDFGAGVSKVIGQISYWPRAGFSGRMLGGVFQGANTPGFADAVMLGTVTLAPPEGGVATPQEIATGGTFRYVRYVSAANGWGNAAEIKFFSPNLPALPPVLTNNWDGTQLILSWANGHHLLEATNLTGPWTKNPTARPPLNVLLGAPQMFYRVQ